MYARIVTVALFLCVALALPVAAEAGLCNQAVVYFQKGDDILNIVNLHTASTVLTLMLFASDGGILGIPSNQASLPIGFRVRTRMTATKFYDLFVGTPAGFISSYVAIIAPPGTYFSATVTHGDVMRELGCLNAPDVAPS